MPSRSRRVSATAAAWASCVVLVAHASAATIRIANWNMGNLPNTDADAASLGTVLSYVAQSRPIDVLAMVETDTLSGPLTAATFGGTYASVMTAADGGGDRTGFAYNTSTLQLVGTGIVGGITHPSLRGQFRPVGTTGSADFYLYAVHLQSGSTSAIKNTRVAQAGVLRADVDALGNGANVIFGGDFNWQKADDVSAGVGAFRTFNASGNGQVFDPVNAVGDWHGNAAFKSLHTNDPGASMDDRFDMQLISGELTDGLGLDYVSGSYTVIGNNGTHAMGGTITTGTGAPASVLNALVAMSDHLPVVADYAFAVPEPASLAAVAFAICAGLRRRRTPA